MSSPGRVGPFHAPHASSPAVRNKLSDRKRQAQPIKYSALTLFKGRLSGSRRKADSRLQPLSRSDHAQPQPRAFCLNQRARFQTGGWPIFIPAWTLLQLRDDGIVLPENPIAGGNRPASTADKLS